MAQLVVRNLEDETRDRLRDLAKSQGQSMEETVREILRRAVMKQSKPQLGLGSLFAKTFSSIGLKEGEEIQELRGQTIEPPIFE